MSRKKNSAYRNGYAAMMSTGAWHKDKNPVTLVTVWGVRASGLPVAPNDYAGPVVPDVFDAAFIDNMKTYATKGLATYGYDVDSADMYFTSDLFYLPGVPVLVLGTPIDGVGHVTILTDDTVLN